MIVVTVPSPPAAPPRSRAGERAAVLGLAAVALLIGLFRVGSTGPLWPDAPRYANGAAMVRDWLAAGAAEHPVRFAEANYRQYPAFSIPFHPPGYPAALALPLWALGESYPVARGFVAVCWALCGWLFLRILRELGTPFWPAAAAALLMLTTPELAVWSRDTMSEVPSLAVVLAGTWCWVRWCHGAGPGWGAGAVGLAGVAFFFRVTTAGVLPGWAVYAVWAGNLTRRRFAYSAAMGAVYFAVGVAWMSFARPYATHEFTADGRGSASGWRFVEYFRECGGPLFLCGTVAALAAAAAGWRRAGRPAAVFWACWFGSYLLFKLMVTTSLEPRHFFTALPALAGLTAAGLAGLSAAGRVRAAVLAVVVGVGLNAVALARLPAGVVGYEAVGRRLATLDRPGNLLFATPEDQDLTFRFRASNPTEPRRCVRSDRTLAVRVSDYANTPAEVLAKTPADVLDVVRKGRIRYVVTFAPAGGSADPRPEEMALVHATAAGHPDQFRAVDSFPLSIDYVQYTVRPHGTVTVWEYLPDLPPGPDELPAVVPTAGLVLKP